MTRYSRAVQWLLSPGDRIVRKELHLQYGGQRQGGIATPRDNILIFTDPSTGVQHDYHDTWIDSELHYAGEGQPQHGDQQMQRGNRAILEHHLTGRPIRVFYGSTGTVEYAGEFELAVDDEPSYYEQRVTSPSGATRTVLMFRLVPVGQLRRAERDEARPLVTPSVPMTEPYRQASVDPSEARTPFTVDPDLIDRGLMGHVTTQNALAAAAVAAGYETHSPGKGDPNYDLAWREPDGSVVVVEVKSLTASNESGQVRLGLGQVLDYAHQLRPSAPAILAVLAVENEPVSPRWLDLCASVGVKLVWPASFSALFQNPG